MSDVAYTNETHVRRSNMLQTAFCGPVRKALTEADTIEVMANPDGTIWIEKAGRGIEQSEHCISASDRERVIRLVASSTGEAASRHAPIISAELPGTGERFEGLLPPVSIAPCFSIRKPAVTPFTLEDYVSAGALSPDLCDALRAAVEARCNILVAGGTSSGKTTFTNALLKELSFEEARLVILEDTRELRCAAPNLVQLRTHRDVSLQQLVRSTLRLRPDRIIVGEVRGGEALDLLKSWNTGHPGGITTLHANSAHGALSRLEQLTLEATSLPPYDLIADAIDIVLFMDRSGGRRRVTEALRDTGYRDDHYVAAPLVSPSLHLAAQGDKR